MGADIYLTEDNGTQVAYFRDSYNTSSVFGVINETLGYEQGDVRALSWWSIANGITLLDALAPAEAVEIHDRILDAFAEMMTIPQWRYGYGSGTLLSTAEREQYAQKICKLLKMLAQAATGQYTMIWSV